MPAAIGSNAPIAPGNHRRLKPIFQPQPALADERRNEV
jgi:hypothetical protein